MKLKHKRRWGWGIYGLNGWGIYGLNGWGIYDLNVCGIYDFKKKKNSDLPAPPTFHCPCATFRRFFSLTSHSGGGTTPRLSKRCIHFYVCLWAFASNENLAREFSRYLSPEHAGNIIRFRMIQNSISSAFLRHE